MGVSIHTLFRFSKTLIVAMTAFPVKPVIGGAAVAVSGLDRAFVSVRIPTGVHWALAGAATDWYSNGYVDSKQVFFGGLGGFVGGLAIMLLRRGKLFPGPLVNI